MRLGKDAILLARLRAGDDQALGHVYDEHASVAFVIARRVTADDHLASEVVQDVFVHLWASPDRVDLSKGSIRSYLGVVAHRRAVDAVRRAVRRGGVESAVTTPQPDALVDDQVADADARRWCRGRLLAAIDALPTARPWRT
ncbi:MAG TPA: sigma factor [Acidimicrobiales bacterium]